MPPLRYPPVVLFIDECIFFSPNLLLVLATLFLLKPPYYSLRPLSLKLQSCLTSYFQGPSTEKEHPLRLFLLSFLRVACHSSNSHFLNSCGLFSKSDKSPSSLHSPIQVVNYSSLIFIKHSSTHVFPTHSRIFNSVSLHIQ